MFYIRERHVLSIYSARAEYEQKESGEAAILRIGSVKNREDARRRRGECFTFVSDMFCQFIRREPNMSKRKAAKQRFCELAL
jgi:hypothetical protein